MAALPFPHVMRARRLIYLQTLLKRHDSELTKRVYMCQKLNPLPGDWSLKIQEDFEIIGLMMNDKEIEDMTENEYKKFLEAYSCVHVQEPGELSLAEVASFNTEEESDPDKSHSEDGKGGPFVLQLCHI